LVQFLLHLKAELAIDESRQVMLLVPFLLELLPTLPLVSPYVALGLDVVNTKPTIDETTSEKESSLSHSYYYQYPSYILTRGNRRGIAL
jgi:hypothetical protein